MSPLGALCSDPTRVAALVAMESARRLEKAGILGQHREDICPTVSPRAPDNSSYMRNKLCYIKPLNLRGCLITAAQPHLSWLNRSWIKSREQRRRMRETERREEKERRSGRGRKEGM